MGHGQDDIRREFVPSDIVGENIGVYAYGFTRSLPKCGIRFQANITRMQPAIRTLFVRITSQSKPRGSISLGEGFGEQRSLLRQSSSLAMKDADWGCELGVVPGLASGHQQD